MATPLVGRERELALLQEELHRTGDRSRLLFVVGAPGVGKSRLLAELQRLASRRATVIVGRGSPLGTATPFGVIAEALHGTLRDLSPSELETLVGDRGRGSTSLVPAISALEGSGPAEAPGRLATLEAIVAMFGAMAATRPLVVALDDVHQADPSTWDLLGYLGRNPLHAPVLVVAASRSTGFADPVAEAMRLDLVKDGLADEVEVGPLGPSDVAELAARTLGSAGTDAELAGWLYQRARGNALFTVELLDELRDDPTRRVVPVSVQERVRASTLGLPATVRGTLEIAAVLGHSFSLRAIAPLIPDDASSDLDELIRLRYLIEREEPGGVVVDFAHPLVQEAIYESMGPIRRRQLHLDVARRSPGASIAERAYHAARGGLPGDEEAITVVLTAAREAEAEESHREAITHLRAALRLLEQTDERRPGVLDEIAWQAGEAADHDTGIAALDELERTIPPDDRIALARTKMRRASFLATGRGDLAAAEREASDAALRLREAGAEDLLGGALNELAWIRGEGGDLGAQIEMSAEALAMAERHGNEVAAMHALGALSHALQLVGRIDESLLANDRALEIARRTRDGGQLGWHTGVRVGALLAAGRLPEAAGIADDILERGNQSEVLRSHRALLNWFVGRWPTALEDCRSAIALQATTPSLHAAWTLSLAGLLETAMGELAAARVHLAQADRLYRDRDFYIFSARNDWAAGCARWLAGDIETAVARLSNAVRRVEELGAAASLLEIVADAVEIQAEAGHPDEARRIAGLGRDAADLVRSPFGAAHAAYAEAIVEPSAEAFFAAADLAGPDLPFLRARALDRAAGMLAGHARRDALAEVVRLSAMLPAPALQGRASTALRGEGAAGRRMAQGVGRLTAREREIAELARRGATTRAIAERLHISERTVESHLGRAYAKLQVSGRMELATLGELTDR